MTLPEFLLARIADDEAGARSLLSRARYAHETLQDVRFLGREQPGWFDWPKVIEMCERVLAECEAKRRIVAAHPLETRLEDIPDEDWDGVGPDQRETTYCAACYGCGCCDDIEERTPACVTLRSLALPYTSHSDYDLAWALAVSASA